MKESRPESPMALKLNLSGKDAARLWMLAARKKGVEVTGDIFEGREGRVRTDKVDVEVTGSPQVVSALFRVAAAEKYGHAPSFGRRRRTI